MKNNQLLEEWEWNGYEETRCKIGNWNLCIHHPTHVLIPQHPEIPNCEKSAPGFIEKNIHLWYNFDLDHRFRKKFCDCCAKAEQILPKAISFFYRALDMANVDFLPPERHCNRYYQYKEWILADFPYESDRFFWIGNLEKDELYVFGKETCIPRILGDLYAIMQERFPLHGCAAAYKGKASCFLGNSNCGKSTVLMHLINHGYQYITDDELYVKDNKIYLLEESIQLRSEWCDPRFRTEEEKVTLDVRELGFETCPDSELDQIYVLHNQNSDPFLQWFPCVARQSVWWLIFLEYNQSLQEWIMKKTITSAGFARTMICNAKHVIVDFNEINNQVKSGKFDLPKMFKEAK